MTRLALAFAALPLLSVSLVVAPPAQACINGVYFDMHKATKLVAKADKALRAGDFSAAVTLINKSHVDDRPRGRKHSNLAERAIRIRAMVVVRTNGRIAWLGKHLRGKKLAPQRAREVARATRTLAQHRKQHPKNPAIAAQYAEALARGDAKARAEALSILRDLRERELLPDPWAWAALAGLETDVKAAKAAQQRCMKIAPEKEREHCRHYLAGGTS